MARPPRNILLVCTRHSGDVLLATPLARSLRRAWPEAELHLLVHEGTETVLEANPDISRVITVRQGAANLGKLWRLWRHYDLAVTPLHTRQALLYCWVAGRWRAGLLQGRSKTRLLNQWALIENPDMHAVAMGLRVAEILGISPCFEVVPPSVAPSQRQALLARLGKLTAAPYCVFHAYSQHSYRMWARASVLEFARWALARGMQVVFTGGPDPEETDYVAGIVSELPAGAVNLAGALSFGETAELIRLAQLYVGPDAVVTHIAAATGTPSIALFGPSNPVNRAPWPRGWESFTPAWTVRGSLRRNNVNLVQGFFVCVPCKQEGCHLHLHSISNCLQQLAVARVIQAAETMLSNADDRKSIEPDPVQ